MTNDAVQKDDKFIKFETHSHCMCSSCGDTNPDIYFNRYSESGYGGAILTNHCSESSYNKYYFGDTHKEKIKYFLSVCETIKEKFQAHGLKFMYAVEVAVLCSSKAHSEYILYGVDEKTLYDNKPLYEFTQEELFRLAEKKGFFMSKVHPFRTNEFSGNPLFMHGAESFNGHYHHENHNDLAKEFCIKNNLIQMSGSDFHHADQPITGGIYLPKNIDTMEQFVEFVFKGKFDLIQNGK